MTRSSLIFVAYAAFMVAGCGGSSDPDQQNTDPTVDAEPALQLDAGTSATDRDAASEPADLGGAEDTGAGDTTPDAGETTPDSGAPASDGGNPSTDSGTRDATVGPDAATPADGGTGLPDSGDPAPAILNPNWIGGPCLADADCSFMGGYCLEGADGWPGGTCTQDCTQFCPDQTGPLNSVTFCIDDGSSGACVSRCDFTLSPTGCRSGYVCLPEKRFNQASVVRSACVPIAGVPNRPAPVFDIGEACASASDCNRSTCLTDLPGGYCTQEACDVVGCPTGSTCFSLGQENYSVCIRDCVSANDCRQAESYTCDADNTCWYVPPPAGSCDLTGAANDCATYASMASAEFAVVTKSMRRLAHCSGTTMLGAYCVGLGSSPVLDKEREGDRRTPEGIFYIPRKIPNSQYYKAFLISYPDSADAARGLQAGLITQAEHDAIVAAQNAGTEPPQQTNLGGLVEIHGGGSGSDWTWGCMAAENTTIDTLWPSLSVGDTVVILH